MQEPGFERIRTTTRTLNYCRIKKGGDTEHTRHHGTLKRGLVNVCNK